MLTHQQGLPASDMEGSPRHLAIACAASVAAASLAVAPLVLNISNPDMFSYVEMAERLARGDLRGSINTYWSPLIAWLLAPLLYVGLDAFLAFRFILVACAVAATVPLAGIICQFLETRHARIAAAVCASLLLVKWTMSVCTPDLLLVVLALSYGRACLKLSINADLKAALKVGFLAGLAYLAKSYFLVFAVVHLSALCAVGAWSAPATRRKRWFVAGIGAFVAMALIAAPWIAAISSKRGCLTLSTAGAYNWRLVNPNSGGHPMLGRLLPPSTPDSLSAWSDPGNLSEMMAPWPSFDASVPSFLRHVYRNLVIALRALWHAAVLLPVALALLGMCLFAAPWRATLTPQLAWIASGALYVLGYTPLLMEERYIWPVLVLAPVVACVLLDKMLRHAPLGRNRVMLVAVFALVSVVLPAYHAVRGVLEIVVSTNRVLQPAIAGGVRVASVDDWHTSLEYCYRAQCQYYGVIGIRDSGAVLGQYSVSHVLVWDPAHARLVPSGYERISGSSEVPWLFAKTSGAGRDGAGR